MNALYPLQLPSWPRQGIQPVQSRRPPMEVDAPSMGGDRARRVLVLDSPRGALRELTREVRQRGDELRVARGVESALRALQSRPAHFVVVPFTSADSEGARLLDAVGATLPDIPVLVQVEGEDLSLVLDAHRRGAAALVRSPARAQDLARALDRTFREGLVRTAASRHLRDAARRREWATRLNARLDEALASAHVAFQPVARLADRKTVALEALVRAPRLGVDSALPLLQLAQRAGRQAELDRRIRTAIARVLDHAPALPFTLVNVGNERVDLAELGHAQDPLHPHAERVVLDLPDDVAVLASPAQMEELARLRRVGFSLCLGDLWTVVTSSHDQPPLRSAFARLHLAELRGGEERRPLRNLARTLVEAAQREGTVVIASAIETHADEELAIDLGCDWGQGYHFGVPAPLRGALESLARLMRRPGP